MIILIMGPSGSGKSHLVRQVRLDYPDAEAIYTPGRRGPLCYLLRRRGRPDLALLGHYEIPNGGIDTLDTLNQAYDLARQHDDAGRDVLMEGKCLSHGTGRWMALVARGRDARVAFLSTPVEQCVLSVRERGHEIAERSIVRVALKCSKARDRLVNDGYGSRVVSGTRTGALAVVRRWLDEVRT